MYYSNKRLATILIFAATVTLGQQAFSQSSIPADKVKEFLSYDDFLFDIRNYVSKSVNVQVPVFSVDLVNRTADVDFQHLIINLKQIEKQKIKDINTLCGSGGVSCFLDVEGTLALNSNEYSHIKYMINANAVALHFLVGVAVDENGNSIINISENDAVMSLTQGSNFANVVSDEFWIDSPSNIVIGFASGLTEFYVGWGADPDLEIAKTDALRLCEESIPSLEKTMEVQCEPIIFEVPWW
jgi:hypothetical protein